MKIEELSPGEITDALQITCLGFVFAAITDRTNPILQAAHGDHTSYIILRHRDNLGWDGWRLTDALKSDRQARYREMITRFARDGQATLTTPDGKPIEV